MTSKKRNLTVNYNLSTKEKDKKEKDRLWTNQYGKRVMPRGILDLIGKSCVSVSVSVSPSLFVCLGLAGCSTTTFQPQLKEERDGDFY
jgi:hypothetical protein